MTAEEALLWLLFSLGSAEALFLSLQFALGGTDD